MKLIIAGSRTIENQAAINWHLDDYVSTLDILYTDLVVVSGTAKGVDKLGEYWAESVGAKVEQFPADWEQYGKLAGFRRNRQMAEYADELIAFWDGQSRGTKHMIECMLKLNKPFQVILIR